MGHTANKPRREGNCMRFVFLSIVIDFLAIKSEAAKQTALGETLLLHDLFRFAD